MAFSGNFFVSVFFAQKNSLIWQMAHKIGEFSAHKYGIIMLVKLNGKIFAKRCAPTNFCLAHKGWYNRPQGNYVVNTRRRAKMTRSPNINEC